MFVHVQCDVVNCYRPIGFFFVTYDVCLKWEFPWSLYAHVGLLVHALSILNFDGLYLMTSVQFMLCNIFMESLYRSAHINSFQN